ncbi:MAG: outer membrane beta-barrel protein [Lutibacter sp.]|uniref:outer membrane beta-barrel protein n=1 Tax=Lutibacter sp. TaxID=1925666 RepID=UPI00299CEEF2|nr:outer membrane beta-barrel protein [Lutibacter sp.]MDX1828109.1 outer membrane beta-barrel protein [Lutibacter sp.]
MKKRIVLSLFAFLGIIYFTSAQSGYGIKAGISYNSNGKFTQIISDTGTNLIDNKGKGKSGFNVGFYGKLDLGAIYIRPELVYTKTTSEYELNSQTNDYKLSKLDVPVLVGFKVIGPLNVFAGPAFQYVLKNDFKGLNYENIKNNFTVGLNIGASIELGKLGLDIRYERGLSKNEAEFKELILGGTIPTYRLDTRPEQIIFSLSYRLSNTNKH